MQATFDFLNLKPVRLAWSISDSTPAGVTVTSRDGSVGCPGALTRAAYACATCPGVFPARDGGGAGTDQMGGSERVMNP